MSILSTLARQVCQAGPGQPDESVYQLGRGYPEEEVARPGRLPVERLVAGTQAVFDN